MKKQLIFLFLFNLILFSQVCIAQQEEYDQLKAKIEAEEGEPHDDDSVSKDFDEYIHWLGIKATDRDRAQELAAKASNAGNPYWEERFLDLVELAQDSGESTLWMADYIFLRIKSRPSWDDWMEVVFKADHYGKRLYLRAQELSFDAEYIRESVRCLMRYALGKVETGHVGLYHNRVLVHGTQYDSEGNLLQPDIDFVSTCLPRSALHIESEGTQGVPVNMGLSNVDQIRDICEWFQLFEYNDGTDLMNQFIQDFLCDDKHNSDKGLQWYLALAKKYKLKKSEEFILGFYGIVRGKVEIFEDKQYKDASGAKVKISDKPNILNAIANDKGRYEIKKAPLHCKCPPYSISAEYEGNRVDSKYKGPLKEPSPSWRHKKDLLISGSKYEWKGTLVFEGSKRFMCKYHAGGQIEENEYTEQKGNLDFTIDQISFIGMSPIAKIGNANGSGSIDITYDSNYERIDKDFYELKRVNAKENFPLIAENLLLLIQKKMTEDPKQMIKRIQEIAKTDPAKAAQELQKMYKVENESTFEVELLIQIVGHWSGNYNYMYKLESKHENKNESRTVEQLIGAPIAVKATGTMKVNKDGTAEIKASYSGSENLPNGKIASFGCPPMTSLTKFELTLNKKKKN